MRAVVQRVHNARVEVDAEPVGEISTGLVAFVGAGDGDTDRDVAYLADKVAGLRIFHDNAGGGSDQRECRGRSPLIGAGPAGKMSRSVKDVGGAVLAISQFTVFGDVRRGRRPSFDTALEPVEAQRLFDRFVARLREHGVPVETGRFGAMMRVFVDNDGPVTILIDSRKQF